MTSATESGIQTLRSIVQSRQITLEIQRKTLHTGSVWAMLGIAFGLRLHRLGAESLWYDELVSVDLARAPIAHLIAQTARDIHPPGYYLLLHMWQRLSDPVMESGHSFEFLFAFPSVFFGMLVCALVYAGASRLFSPQAGLLALAFAAVHPFHLEYSQEVRMYTLGSTLCLLYFLLSYRLLRPNAAAGAKLKSTRFPAINPAIPLAIITAMGLYTFYYFGFLIAAMALFALGTWLSAGRGASNRTRSGRYVHWLAAHGLAGLLWLPWMPIFLRQALDPPVPPWREPWHGLSETLAALLQTTDAYFTGHGFASMQWLGQLAAMGLLLLVGFGYILRRHASPLKNGLHLMLHMKFSSTQSTSPAVPQRKVNKAVPMAALMVAAFGPPLLIILISATLTPLFHPRYLFPYHAAFLILSAAGLVWLYSYARRTATAAIACLLVLFVAGSIELWTDPARQTDDHRGAVSQIAHEWRPGDVILVNAGWVFRAFNVYWPRELTSADSALPPPLAQRERIGSSEGPADIR